MDWSKIRHFSEYEFGGDPDPKLVRMLDEARDIAAVPFVITSGVRTAKENAAIGGADDSAHVTGHAVDLRCRTSRERFLTLRALFEAGFDRIGVYNHHVHCDTSTTADPAVVWVGKSK